MRWFRSELVQDQPASVIAHQFICPNCQGVGRRDTKYAPIIVLPDKLSAPRLIDAA